MSFLKQEGECIARRGYWGDILVSPYISFGIECEEKEFFKTANNIHVKVVKTVLSKFIIKHISSVIFICILIYENETTKYPP